MSTLSSALVIHPIKKFTANLDFRVLIIIIQSRLRELQYKKFVQLFLVLDDFLLRLKVIVEQATKF